MTRFTNEEMSYIIDHINSSFKNSNRSSYSFEVINPDIKVDAYAGEILIIEEKEYIYRSYNSWNNLAQILFCKMKTPDVIDDKIVKLTFVRLNETLSFHNDEQGLEKYGTDSNFSKLNKNEEPSFIYYYTKALESVNIKTKRRILNLGVNRADEFEVVSKLLEGKLLNKEFIGIDISKSAIEFAKKRFPQDNYSFHAHDISDLKSLNLKKSDLLISIGTLQSSSLNLKEIIMKIYQENLEDKASIILGFPNCRWFSGEMVYGAKPPNYNYNEMSILYNDIIFCKKYLQQKKYRVTITGKDYIFLTATSIKK